MNYPEYLKSDHWRSLKAQKAAKTDKCCAICGSSEKIDCHHIRYKKLLDVKTEDLRWLCRTCHDITHDLLRAKKIQPRDRNKPQAVFILTKILVLKERKLRGLTEATK